MANLFKMKGRCLAGWLFAWAMFAGGSLRGGETATVEINLSGAGMVTNRRLARTLQLLKSDAAERPHYDAADIEDAGLIILAQLNDQGYLDPELAIRLELADGSRHRYLWDAELYTRLPRNLQATKVAFRVRRGPRFYLRRIEFAGLTAIEDADARRFFMGVDFLLRLKRTRIYTPSRLANGLNALLDALRRQGYEEASATVASLIRDPDTGAVKVLVDVREGPQTRVRSLRREIVAAADQPPTPVSVSRPAVPYSRAWMQDLAQEWRRETFRQGFPDASVAVGVEERETAGEATLVDVALRLTLGQRVRLDRVDFRGLKHTKASVLRRRTRLAPGDWLDRVEAEQARFRLSRLGIFDRVELAFEPEDEATRNAVFTVRESRRTEVSVLFGYGSYEMLRGGVEWERRNLFGLAHRSRLRARQSFKSTTLDSSYLMPDMLPGQTDIVVNAMFMRREEIDFIRYEYGAGVGLQRFITRLQSHAGLQFNYGRVEVHNTDIDEGIGPQRSIVSAWLFDLSHDRRDNPLSPRRGWNLAVHSETASQIFGGDANYQRFELNGSYHVDLGGGRYLHLGARHGLALAFGAAGDELPLAKRFFPGGENSVRGYRRGEASPLDAEGRAIGAESYLLGNLEIEQALTPSWALVGFLDAVGLAEAAGDYPFDEGLYSIGFGIRWTTVVGPVRLEYARNLRRREHDPQGALHISVGFPF